MTLFILFIYLKLPRVNRGRIFICLPHVGARFTSQSVLAVLLLFLPWTGNVRHGTFILIDWILSHCLDVCVWDFGSEEFFKRTHWEGHWHTVLNLW
jgi:hypothetical protein